MSEQPTMHGGGEFEPETGIVETEVQDPREPRVWPSPRAPLTEENPTYSPLDERLDTPSLANMLTHYYDLIVKLHNPVHQWGGTPYVEAAKPFSVAIYPTPDVVKIPGPWFALVPGVKLPYSVVQWIKITVTDKCKALIPNTVPVLINPGDTNFTDGLKLNRKLIESALVNTWSNSTYEAKLPGDTDYLTPHSSSFPGKSQVRIVRTEERVTLPFLATMKCDPEYQFQCYHPQTGKLYMDRFFLHANDLHNPQPDRPVIISGQMESFATTKFLIEAA